jgi:hypothetical protein
MAADSSVSGQSQSGWSKTFGEIFDLLEQGFRIVANTRSAIRNDTPYIGYPQPVSAPNSNLGALIGNVADGLPIGKYIFYIFLGILAVVLVSKLAGGRR